MTQEPKIGDHVRATMNGEDWFTGRYVQESEIFAQYGVLRDDIKEVRFFVHAEPIAQDEPPIAARKQGGAT